MAPTFPFTGLDPVEIFAIEDTVAQLVWRRLPAGELGVIVDGQKLPMGAAGSPGAAEISGLRPNTVSTFDIAIDGQLICQRRMHTEPEIAGPELSRIATISDLHLGEEGFGLLKEMRERPKPTVGYPMRCARAAVREAVAWGAQLLVIKGDITEDGKPAHWDLVDEFLDDIPIPVMALPGNHDTTRKNCSLDAAVELQRRGLFAEPVQVCDMPGVRVVAADSTIPGHSWGRIGCHTDALCDAVDVSTPVLLFLHQHLEERRLPTFWPLGTPRRDAAVTLEALLGINPDLLVSSGHTHRNRARRHGSAVITEVGSTKDHPGVWAGYVVHHGGVRQVVRRVAEPSCLEWTERTHAVVGGIWGQWSPGRIEDRSFTHRWVRQPVPARPQEPMLAQSSEVPSESS